ncbi:MAG: YfhO family protein [Patescibacteria group bacterium]
MKYLKTNKYLFLFGFCIIVFFHPFWLTGKLPIPADALVGLYHPWRDAFFTQFPNGVPYKNPLITDPFRQQYSYRILAIEELKKGQLPNWNPYSFSGTPLLSNIQSAVWYPLNILFWIFPNEIAWSILVFLQPLLAGVFLYAYLRNLGLGERACYLGAITFAFSGFMVSWLEWNTIGHTALWLPLILLAKDKLIVQFRFKWAAILVLAESSMILAGHLQTAIYVLLISTVYLWVRIWLHHEGNPRTTLKKSLLFFVTAGITLVITSIQWIPTLHFILSSARQFDLSDWHRPDWFIPWSHLVQFIAPDFFGNPATGNYYGIWNYGEFIGYVALFPLLMAIFAILARRDRKTIFYVCFLALSVLLAVPNFISQLPYVLKIPLLSTLQPSRILILIDFCLSVLAALGLDYIVKPEKEREKRMVRILVFGFLTISILWLLVIFGSTIGLAKDLLNVQIAGRNLALPTVLFVLSAFGMLGLSRFALKKIILTRIFIIILLSTTLFDFYRFFHKFTPFTDRKLLFPITSTIEFLQKNLGNYRFMTTDRRIMPPNVSVFYKLQSVDGYDPLYLKNYAEVVASWTRGMPDISPAAFNRILTPENVSNFWPNLLGVKYILALTDDLIGYMPLVFREGETRIYENLTAYPRAFLVEKVSKLQTPEKVIQAMYENQLQLDIHAYTTENIETDTRPLTPHETVTILRYEPNYVSIDVYSEFQRVLVLTDIYYSRWQASIDNQDAEIFPVDLALRGILIPAGRHEVVFKY